MGVEVETVEVDCVELRRLKGMLGRRYSGKGVVGVLGAIAVVGAVVTGLRGRGR